VLAIGMDMKKMPRNGGKEIIYRKYLPYGAATTNGNTINRWSVDALAHLTQEGVTPTAERMEKYDTSAFMQQYSCLYATSDQALDLGEDGAELPGELKTMVGERMGLVRELVRYSSLKACTNILYAGGTTRLTVDEKIGQTVLRKAVRSLEANHAKKRTQVLAAGTGFNTSGVQPGYFGFAHTDCRGDIEDLPGFKHVHEYGTRKPVHDNEIGEAGGVRWILSAELAPYTDAGAATGATGLYSSGTKVDVYPIIIMGQEAAFDVALRGAESMTPTWIPPSSQDKSDPLGQRGYAGCKFYSCATVANPGWMIVIEAGITAY
jgi:N4-gp56 family major capsid protein